VHYKPPICFALSAVAFFPQLWLGVFIIWLLKYPTSSNSVMDCFLLLDLHKFTCI